MKRTAIAALAIGLMGCTGSLAEDGTLSPVSNLEDVRGAVVRIETEGTYAYPGEGQVEEEWSGSGFLVSNDGLIVTNSHVIAGADSIEVFVEGQSTPTEARVLGTSECTDLAVIDIDGTDLPFLAWSPDAIKVGQEILIAGFPLGDPEYTLIDGIVSKERANGETDWASIESVFEHSGDTLSGSSGGPIVTTDGLVLGVNYAGDDLGQAYGISVATAKSVVDSIVAGEPALSIGLNGWADEIDGTPVVWVSSVTKGTPADQVGLKAGDAITRFNGRSVDESITLDSFCETLSSHLPDKPFDIEVWRESTDSILQGTVHSGKELEASPISLSESQADKVSEGSNDPEYDFIVDRDLLMSFDAPAEWSEVKESEWTDNNESLGVTLTASPNTEAFAIGWDTPGVAISISPVLIADFPDPVDFLYGPGDLDDCQFEELIDYDDGHYIGAFSWWSDCGETGAVYIEWAARDLDGEYLISGEFVVLEEGDVDVVAHIMDTFFLSKDLVDA